MNVKHIHISSYLAQEHFFELLEILSAENKVFIIEHERSPQVVMLSTEAYIALTSQLKMFYAERLN